MVSSVEDMILYTVHGALGAFLAILMWSKSFRDLKTYETFQHVLIGAISGYIYYYLHSEYSLPNSLMAIVVGYFGKDFVEALMERLRALIK